MFKRKVKTPRWVILAEDPSIDSKKSNYKEYLESFFDEKHLVFKDNEKPTRFKIQQLTSNHRESLSDEREGKRIFNTIRFALIDIENYYIDNEGIETEVSKVEREKEGNLGEVVTIEWMRKQNFEPFIINNLYIAISYFSSPTPFLSMQ